MPDVLPIAEKHYQNIIDINTAVTGCKDCSDYEIVPAYLALTCNDEECIREINDNAGGGVYFVNNN